jgi:cysteine desulfurase
VGALYISPYMIKRRAVSPIIFGGGQEFSFRSGTENLPGIAGFGAAAAAQSASLEQDIAAMTSLRDKLPAMLADDPILSNIAVNVPQSKERAPHIVSLRMPKIKSETMLNFLSGKGIAVSSGSACSAQSGRISSALLCFGLTEAEADTTLRISLCAQNTEEELAAFCDALRPGIKMLARMKR